jgi:hypothetical protein
MRLIHSAALASALAASSLAPVPAADPPAADVERYARTVEAVAAMPGDPHAILYSMKYGLRVMNVTWEDTGRYW